MYFDRLQLKESCSSTKQTTYSLSFLLKFSRLRLEFNFKQLWKIYLIKCQLDPKTTGDMGEVRGMGGRYGKVIFKSLEPPAFHKYSICWVFETRDVRSISSLFETLCLYHCHCHPQVILEDGHRRMF